MKQAFLIVFVFSSLICYSQDGFNFILIDSKGRTDTVLFGMNYDATSGIDIDFGEVNIYGTAIDSLEIRSIQRISDNHLCLNSSSYENDGDPLYFPENVDLKRDFRKFELFSPINNNFEFTVNAIEYPLKIISDFTKWQPIGTWGIWIGILNYNCDIISSSYSDQSKVDTIFIDTDKSVMCILVKFDHEVNIHEVNENYNFELITNPITNEYIFIINKANTKNAIVSIYSIIGDLVYTQMLNGNNIIEISKLNFKKGMYLVNFIDDNIHQETIKIIIK
jgi:hypothetical protein